MKTYLWLILVCPSLTGCITISTIDKAKFDKKPEKAESILSSYKDNDGNTTIIYTKTRGSQIYKFSQPVDSIIEAYRKSRALDLVNPVLESNFKGVFYTANVNNEKGYQRMLLFDQEMKMKDTSGLADEISSNRNIVNGLDEKILMPFPLENNAHAFKYLRSKGVAFMVDIDSADNTFGRKEQYVILFRPHRRSYARYLLVPLTAGLDVITSPFQLIFFGTFWMWEKIRTRPKKSASGT